MKLNEAITDLSIQREVKRRLGKNHEANALGLGIEALKWYIEAREGPVPSVYHLLPGETEE